MSMRKGDPKMMAVFDGDFAGLRTGLALFARWNAISQFSLKFIILNAILGTVLDIAVIVNLSV